MTTFSNATRIRHDSDDTFREWVQEWHNALAAIGLVQTSDTGQITISSATRPAQNVNAGYEVWRFNDTLQATAPIFIKFQYGTGSATTTTPRINISIGTGTNGAGTLTQTGMSGTMTTERSLTPSSTGGSGQTSDVGRPSSYCHAEGFLGISWKNSTTAVTGLPGLFLICRTCDSTGTPDARGCLVDFGNSAASANIVQAIRFEASAVAYTEQSASPNNQLGMLPQAPVNTNVGGLPQVALAWTIVPLSEPLFGVCGVYPNEIGANDTFQATLVGQEERTFMSIGAWPFGQPTTMRLAMLWE